MTPAAAGRLWELPARELLLLRSRLRLRPRCGEIRLKKLLMEVLTERLAGVSWLEVGVLLTRDTADTELDLGEGRSPPPSLMCMRSKLH